MQALCSRRKVLDALVENGKILRSGGRHALSTPEGVDVCTHNVARSLKPITGSLASASRTPSGFGLHSADIR